MAQDQAGSLVGRVTDSASAPVPSAMLHVVDTREGAVSGEDGRYRIAGIAPGQHSVIVRRQGFITDTFVVTIDGAQSAQHDIVLRAIPVELARIVVTASPRLNETPQAALDKQRKADNIVTVMSGDEIRALPNANAAEAAARIPGVSTERDEGEGKFVQIRGTEPRLSNVTVDGVHIPGTSQGDRIAKLDDVPTDLLGAIEVTKTLTADMEADAIGGSVNLVTKIPEGAPRGYLSGQLGQSTLLSHRQGQGSGTFGGRFGEDKRLGALFSGSYDRNNRVINDVELGWTVDDAGHSIPVEFDERDYTYYRERYGAGGQLDYRFRDGGSAYVRGLFSLFKNWGTRYRYDISADGIENVSGATATGTDIGASREVSQRRPTEQLYGFSGGGAKTIGLLDFNLALNYAGTRQSVSDYRTSPFKYKGDDLSGLALDARNPEVPVYHYLNATDAANAVNPQNYLLSRYTTSDGLTTGRDLGGQLDATWHYTSTSTPGAIKFGVKVRDERKDFGAANTRFNAVTDYALAQAMGGFSDPHFYDNVTNAYSLGPVPGDNTVHGAENANPSGFENATDSLDNLISSFKGAEKVYAGYVMNTVDVGRLRVNVGLRVENTRVNYTGHQEGTDTTTGNTSVSTVSGTSSYTDLFPSLQLRYALGSVTNVRAAVTRAIARPNYYDLAPHISGQTCGGVCNTITNAASAGNPDLKPQHAWNYDLLFEHYLPAAGIVSGGLFYKQINGFQYDRIAIYNGPATQFDGNYVSLPVNGGNGHLTGVEADYAQHLWFLPGALQGLGFDVNWTHVWSKATLLQDASEDGNIGLTTSRSVALPRQSPDIANVALVYDSPRFSLRAAWQYQGANIVSYADGSATAGGDTYFYAHSQIDASVIFNVTRDVALQLQGLNLNNAVFGFFNGRPGSQFNIQREYYGRSVIFGAKYGF
ncbi:MAG: TonB-dependent receptor [Gemmatimonadota bacterium]